MCLWFFHNSVKVARAALSRGVYPAREVSAHGDPWPGWEGSDSGSGRQEVRAGPADQRALEAPAGSGGEACSQGGAEAAEGWCGRP